MKLIITRSYSKTKQVASFEPINSFCSLQAEFDGTEINDQKIVSISGNLDILVRQEVERTIEKEMAKVEAIKRKKIF